MKKILCVVVIFVCSIVLLGGCLATQKLKKTSKSGQAENELYAQVPERYRNPVEKAKADQLGAAERLNFADEKVKLAKLQKEMATKKEKLSNYQLKLAQMSHKEAMLGVELTQWEAIDKAGLGEKEKNIKTIYSLRSKKARIETNRLDVQRDHDTLQLHIKKLAEQIKAQEDTVATMSAVLEGTGDAPPPADPSTEASEAPAGTDGGQQ